MRNPTTRAVAALLLLAVAIGCAYMMEAQEDVGPALWWTAGLCGTLLLMPVVLRGSRMPDRCCHKGCPNAARVRLTSVSSCNLRRAEVTWYACADHAEAVQAQLWRSSCHILVEAL